MTPSRLFAYLLGLFLLPAGSACQERPPSELDLVLAQGTAFDLYIRDGRVVDGTGDPGRAADVLVRGDSIAYVGAVDTTRLTATRTIDAAGRVVAPGFIDTHAHGNPIGRASFENFAAMGVTTVVLGQDGSGPFDADADLAAWMREVEARAIDVNVATLVGHGTLRAAAGIYDAASPTDAQVERMAELLEASMRAGSFGMSTGLEYVPGLYAPEKELLRLAEVVGRYDGLIMSHMRSEDDDAIEAAIAELARQGEHARVHVSHLKVVYGKGPDRASDILGVLDRVRQDGVQITADVYPYMAGYTGIGIVFPDWAKTPPAFEKALETRRAELEAYLYERIQQRNGPEATLFGTRPYEGKTLAEVAEAAGKSYVDVLLDIGPTGASGAYFVMDEPLQEVFIADPDVMISTDGSPTMRHPRGYGTYARILERYVREHEALTLEAAIRKMTSLPAATLGLTDRGLVRPGMKADLVVFHPDRVHEAATWSDPFQLAEGFDILIVNGRIAREDGRLHRGAGQVIRRPVSQPTVAAPDGP